MDNKEKLENRERIKNAKWRQRFHIEPPDGWLNDPNGLSSVSYTHLVYTICTLLSTLVSLLNMVRHIGCLWHLPQIWLRELPALQWQ